MSPADASKLLDLPAEASPDQLEARFNELRAKLEDKIAKAPTPGLKAKYRESLDDITTAFETLTLAADSSSLPVLMREMGTEGEAPSPRERSPAAANPKSRIEHRKSGKEFFFVAFLAVVLLTVGGWFVMKTRAENAEKARIAEETKVAAEAKAANDEAEAERKAEAARLAAETQRMAEEAEKVRLAAAAKAEENRQSSLLVNLRTQLAEIRLEWGEVERQVRLADQALSELRSELRSPRTGGGSVDEPKLTARVAAQQDFADWLNNRIARHPARVLRARAEELVSARAADEAARAVAELAPEVKALLLEIDHERQQRLVIRGSLRIESEPTGSHWRLIDAFGLEESGTTPATVDGLGIGPGAIIFQREGWVDIRQDFQVVRTEVAVAKMVFPPAVIELTTQPSGATVWQESAMVGRTPLTREVAPGRYLFEFKLEGHYPNSGIVTATGGQTTRQQITLSPLPTAADLARQAAANAFWETLLAHVWRGKVGAFNPITFEFISPNNIQLSLFYFARKQPLGCEILEIDAVNRTVTGKFTSDFIPGIWKAGDEFALTLVADDTLEMTYTPKQKKTTLTPQRP